jgi:hypothetical protein
VTDLIDFQGWTLYRSLFIPDNVCDQLPFEGLAMCYHRTMPNSEVLDDLILHLSRDDRIAAKLDH